MTDINLLRDRLDEIGNEAGLLPVDIGRARARGRRVLRLRRAATGAGAVATIGIIAVALAVTGRAAPPGGGAGSTPQAHMVAPRDQQLLETASFGWLPAGLAADSFVADSQSRPYFEVDAGIGGGPGPVVMLTDYGRGPQPALPRLPGGGIASLIPAADVNGHRAYWITAPTIGPHAQLNFELRWQYAPHRWADLQGSSLAATSVASVRHTAYKIADSAVLGKDSPTALPIGVTGVPHGLRVRRTVLNSGAGRGALIFFAGRDLAPSDSIQVSVIPTGLVRHQKGNPGSGHSPGTALNGVTTNTVIDGHPAYDSQLAGQSGAATLWVFGVHGWAVEINAGASAVAAMPTSHTLIWLFTHMTVTTGSHRPAAN